MTFDGRSYNIAPLHYTFSQRVRVLLATRMMPLLGPLLLSDRLNTWVWKRLGVQAARGAVIRIGTQINAPFKVSIGRFSQIHGCLLSRGGITIGQGVELVADVLVSSQSHNMDSIYFESVYAPVIIGDQAWIGPRAIVLAGTRLGTGTVVAAGAVMRLRETQDWAVYAGVPARPVKSRAPLKEATADEQLA